MKPKHIKKLLMSEIKNVANEPHNYCTNPDTDFTRNRKLSMENLKIFRRKATTYLG